MKKSLFSFLLMGLFCIGTVTDSLAQTEPGNFMVGGSVGNLEFRRGVSSFSVSPSGGYFIAEGLAIGTQLNFNYTRFTAEYSPVQEGRTIGYGVGPFVNYYLGNSKLRPLITASYLYTYSRQDMTAQIGETTSQSFSAGGGVAYFVSNNVAFQSIVSYNRDLIRNATSPNSIRIHFGFQIFLGR